MGTAPSPPLNQSGSRKLARLQIYVRKISLAIANASSNASIDYRNPQSHQMAKINLSDYLFHRGKSYFLNRKMPENSGNSLPDNKMKLYRQYNAYKSITDLMVR